MSSESTAASPPPGTMRLIVGGDSRDDKSQVLPWAFSEAKARGATGFVFLGDMELTGALSASFEAELQKLDPVPLYPVLGNHEVLAFGFIPVGRHHAEKRFRDRFLGTARTPMKSALADRVVYSVDFPNGVHFVALDNVSAKGFGKDQLAWLDADLDRAKADPSIKRIIVGMHKPLAKNGETTHSMDADGAVAIAESDAALGSFQRHGVALIVASHLHQVSHWVQGGVPVWLTGGLGAPLTKAGPEHAYHHFLQVDVTDTQIDVTVV